MVKGSGVVEEWRGSQRDSGSGNEKVGCRGLVGYRGVEEW